MNVIHIDPDANYQAVCAYLADNDQPKKLVPPSVKMAALQHEGEAVAGFWCQDKVIAKIYLKAGIPEIDQSAINSWLTSKTVSDEEK